MKGGGRSRPLKEKCGDDRARRGGALAQPRAAASRTSPETFELTRARVMGRRVISPPITGDQKAKIVDRVTASAVSFRFE